MPTTETEMKLMAAAAMIGLESSPKNESISRHVSMRAAVAGVVVQSKDASRAADEPEITPRGGS